MDPLKRSFQTCSGEVFVNLAQVRAIMLEEGASAEKMPPSEWPAGKSSWHFLNQ